MKTLKFLIFTVSLIPGFGLSTEKASEIREFDPKKMKIYASSWDNNLGYSMSMDDQSYRVYCISNLTSGEIKCTEIYLGNEREIDSKNFDKLEEIYEIHKVKDGVELLKENKLSGKYGEKPIIKKESKYVITFERPGDNRNDKISCSKIKKTGEKVCKELTQNKQTFEVEKIMVDSSEFEKLEKLYEEEKKAGKKSIYDEKLKLNQEFIDSAHYGEIDKVKILLQKGVDIDYQGENGVTALMEAAIRRYTDMLKLLLERGANIKIKDDEGKTALHWAAGAGNKIETELLIKQGSDINAKDKNGWTALRHASNKSEIVKLLLDNGADINIKDKYGSSVLRYLAYIDESNAKRILGYATEQINLPSGAPNNIKIIVGYHNDFLKDYNAGFPILLKKLSEEDKKQGDKKLKQAVNLKAYIDKVLTTLYEQGAIPEDVAKFHVLPHLINFGMWMTVVHPEIKGFESFIDKIEEMTKLSQSSGGWFNFIKQFLG